jgi:hypothetical protein
MNNLLRKLADIIRQGLGLPGIEHEIEQLRTQLAEQEVRITAMHALSLNQQHLLSEKIDRVDQYFKKSDTNNNQYKKTTYVEIDHDTKNSDSCDY